MHSFSLKFLNDEHVNNALEGDSQLVLGTTKRRNVEI